MYIIREKNKKNIERRGFYNNIKISKNLKTDDIRKLKRTYLELEKENQTITYIEGEDINLITDKLGVKTESKIQIYFIDRDTIAIGIIWGIIYIEQKGKIYTLEDTNQEIREKTEGEEDIKWVNTREIYKKLKYIIERKYPEIDCNKEKYNLVFGIVIAHEKSSYEDTEVKPVFTIRVEDIYQDLKGEM